MVTKITTEKKFSGKVYTLIYVAHNSLNDGYGGESATKKQAIKQSQKLRDAGFASRVSRETHIRYPPKGPEIFYAVYARKEGMTLDQVKYAASKVIGHLY